MHRLLPFWLVLPALGGCGSDTTTPPASPGKVTLAITKLLPQDSLTWCSESAPEDESCTARQPEPVVIGCDRELGVTVDVQNFSLRVPDACGSSPQCGFLSLTLDPDAAPITVTGAAKTLLFDLKDLHEQGQLDGEHVLRPALFLTSDHPFTHPFTADPVDVPVTFQAVPDEDCAAASGGTGGKPGSAGTGGTSGRGGSSTGGSAGNALGGAAGESAGGAAGESASGAAGETQGGAGGQGGAGAGQAGGG
jgi:hypothetical protein